MILRSIVWKMTPVTSGEERYDLWYGEIAEERPSEQIGAAGLFINKHSTLNTIRVIMWSKGVRRLASDQNWNALKFGIPMVGCSNAILTLVGLAVKTRPYAL